MNMLYLELLILLFISFLGARLQGISLTMLGSLGLIFFIFGLGIQPAAPPLGVILSIASIIVAVGAVEASGGLGYLIYLAEVVIRRHPKRIIYFSPLATYLLTFLAGTNHISYSILPIIAQVSKGVGVRPVFPLTLSVIAALYGTLSSPISSIMVIMREYLTPLGIDVVYILKILIPSTSLGLLMAMFIMAKFNTKLPSQPLASHAISSISSFPRHVRANWQVKVSISLFFLGSMFIVLSDSVPFLRPCWYVNEQWVYLSISSLLPLVMLSTAALIMLICHIEPSSILQGRAFMSGVEGMFALLGIAWLSTTFVEHNKTMILDFIAVHISSAWQFAIVLLVISAIMGSPAATLKAIFPLGIALGLSPKAILVTAMAANGVFIIPIYPTILSAISLDTTGTTRIGKYFLNHSFMLPGLLTVLGSILAGFLLTHFCA